MKKVVSLLLGNDPQAIQSHLSIHLEEIQEIANTVCIKKFFSSKQLIILNISARIWQKQSETSMIWS